MSFPNAVFSQLISFFHSPYTFAPALMFVSYAPNITMTKLRSPVSMGVHLPFILNLELV
jgi:hypothetical protein